MSAIASVAVIGAGTMGSGIASHLTNAGIPVVLLDIVPPGAGVDERSALARRAVERLLDSSPPAFMQRANAELITPGNLEDDLHLLAQADWIAEAIVERLDDKRALYRRIEPVRKPGSFVTSNTSTLPLELLVEGMPVAFRRDFCITHFFNPVRYMRLLELVAGPDTRAEVTDTLREFCDVALGKGVVTCRDTPGFLGNRVGVYALQVGIIEALAYGLTVEEADVLMSRPMGIPKTGVFGLYDLIGIDLMLDVVHSLALPLPHSDPFHDVAPGIPIVHTLVESGRRGNKSGAGFYRTRVADAGPQKGERIREAVDLETGAYRPATRPRLAAAEAGERDGLAALVDHPDRYGRFAWRVLARTLSYAAALIPEVADTPQPVDEAMKLGYSWSHGPFEMIDALGPERVRRRLEEDGLPVPAILEALGDGRFYRVRDGRIEQFSHSSGYMPLARAPGTVRLSDMKRTRERVLGNAAASLWEVDDDVACVEFHSKANSLSAASMEVLAESLQRAPGRYRALLVHSDAPHFSVGFDLNFVLECARRRAWSELDSVLEDFQRTCRLQRDVPLPVLAAPSGLALGGGFEVLVHCDRVQAHGNTTVGLVETLVGLVPAGGGCKQLLARWSDDADGLGTVQAASLEVFALIATARTATSPPEAVPLRLLRAEDRTTMNRDRLLGAAKRFALDLAADYVAPPPPRFLALGDEGREAMEAELEAHRAAGRALPHDLVVGRALARVLSGGDASRGESLDEERLLALEREAFVSLAENPHTVARIEHMLETGRALRN